jgi:hypothetical protein
MAYEPRNNSGIMFPNTRKKPESRQPDFTGTIIVDGVEYEISAWEREGRRGKFWSIALQTPGFWRTQSAS